MKSLQRLLLIVSPILLMACNNKPAGLDGQWNGAYKDYQYTLLIADSSYIIQAKEIESNVYMGLIQNDNGQPFLIYGDERLNLEFIEEDKLRLLPNENEKILQVICMVDFERVK